MTEETVSCPSCEHENAPAASFCEQCGTSLEVPEAAEQTCPNCGEANNPQARFCRSCGEALEAAVATETGVKAETTAPAEQEKKARRRLPGWARVLLTTLVVMIVAAGCGLGFAYVSPFLDTLITYSPSRMQRAGDLAQELVDQVYPDFAEAEREVSVSTSGGVVFYVVDFFGETDEYSLALRIVVDKYITAARALEYIELGPPEPYIEDQTAAAVDDSPTQTVLSEGVQEVLEAPEIVLHDDFSGLDESEWWMIGDVEFTAGGEAELVEPASTVTRLGRTQQLNGGEAFMIFLSFSTGSEFEVSLSKGDLRESGSLRAGFEYADGGLASYIWLEGPERIDEQALEGLSFIPGSRYGVLGAVDDQGSLLFMIWDEQDPSQAVAFRKDFGAEAAGSPWEMHVGLVSGTVTVDDYYALEFSGFR